MFEGLLIIGGLISLYIYWEQIFDRFLRDPLIIVVEILSKILPLIFVVAIITGVVMIIGHFFGLGLIGVVILTIIISFFIFTR